MQTTRASDVRIDTGLGSRLPLSSYLQLAGIERLVQGLRGARKEPTNSDRRRALCQQYRQQVSLCGDSRR